MLTRDKIFFQMPGCISISQVKQKPETEIYYFMTKVALHSI